MLYMVHIYKYVHTHLHRQAHTHTHTQDGLFMPTYWAARTCMHARTPCVSVCVCYMYVCIHCMHSHNGFHSFIHSFIHSFMHAFCLLRYTTSAAQDLTDKSDMAMAELRQAKEEVNEKMKAKQLNCSYLSSLALRRSAGFGRCKAKVR